MSIYLLSKISFAQFFQELLSSSLIIGNAIDPNSSTNWTSMINENCCYMNQVKFTDIQIKDIEEALRIKGVGNQPPSTSMGVASATLSLPPTI
jgi:hypothetical protein